jgi:hypothetical protein
MFRKTEWFINLSPCVYKFDLTIFPDTKNKTKQNKKPNKQTKNKLALLFAKMRGLR